MTAAKAGVDEVVTFRDDPLTDVQEARRDELECVVAINRAGFIAAGEALAEINAARLYRSTHHDFVGYLADRWDITGARGYQLIAAAHVSTIVDTAGLPLPKNEAQARELHGLEDAQVIAVYSKAVEATGGKPTAKAIRDARLPFEKPKPRGPEGSGTSARRPSGSGAAMTAYRDPVQFVNTLTGFVASTLPAEQFKTLDWTQMNAETVAAPLDRVDRMLALLAEVRARLAEVANATTSTSHPKPPITILVGANTAKCGYEYPVGEALGRLGIRAMPDVANPRSGLRALPAQRAADLAAALEADGHLVEVVQA